MYRVVCVLWCSVIVDVCKMTHVKDKSPRWDDFVFDIVYGFRVTRLVIIIFFLNSSVLDEFANYWGAVFCTVMAGHAAVRYRQRQTELLNRTYSTVIKLSVLTGPTVLL